MTKTKMIRQLEELAEKYGLHYAFTIYLDKWNNNTEREADTICHVLTQFRNGEGPLYDKYSTTSSFNGLKKRIESQVPNKWVREYEDSKEAYIKKWEEENPGKNFLEEERKKEEERRKKWMGMVPLATFPGGYPFYVKRW